MNDSHRPSPRLLLAATALSMSLALPAHAAAASDTDKTASADDNQQLAEIVVTAQKRPENLQKTPIAISVLTADASSTATSSRSTTWAMVPSRR